MSTSGPSDSVSNDSVSNDSIVPRPVELPAVAPENAAPQKKPRRLGLIVGIVIGALVLAGAGVAAFLLLTPTAEAGPSAAVLGYDRAYAEVDCDLFVAVTTETYREALAPTCADFEAEAQAFVDNFTDYEIVIESTEVAGDTATIVTTESWVLDGQANSAEYTYALVRTDGTWRIDELD